MTAQRDHARFAALLHRHADSLYRAGYRLAGNRPDAEDLVQEVCVRAFESFADLARADQPLAWLLKVQYRVFLDGARRRRRSPLEPMRDDFESLPADDPGPDALAESALAERRFERAWDALEKQQRALLGLQAEGYTLAEIREITDLSTDVLKARLYRARVRLGNLLVTHNAAPAAVLEI
jgi:RNA polymerase sigma-70 factor (ECF subfamily)